MAGWLLVLVLVQGGGVRGQEGEGGTYNPKSAWLMVDSRRRVLPDIDVEKHFASVERHILSDIHNYHMGGYQARAGEPADWEDQLQVEARPVRRVVVPGRGHRRRGLRRGNPPAREQQYEEDEYLDEEQYEEEYETEQYDDKEEYDTELGAGRWPAGGWGERAQYRKVAGTGPVPAVAQYREVVRGQQDYPATTSGEAQYPGPSGEDEYLGPSGEAQYMVPGSPAQYTKYQGSGLPLQQYPDFPQYDQYYDSEAVVSTAEPLPPPGEPADRQFTTIGSLPGHSVLGMPAQSAVGLLGLLLFINILRDVIQQITGGRRRRRRAAEELPGRAEGGLAVVASLAWGGGAGWGGLKA